MCTPPATNTRKSQRIGATGKNWGNPVIVILTIELDCQAHVRVANVTKRETGDSGRRGTSSMGGRPRRNWMEMVERQPQDGDALKEY